MHRAPANIVLPDSPPVSPPARIALVGAGAFGRFCIEAYGETPDLEVVAVADPRRDALDGLGAPPPLKSDWRSALSRPDIEVVHLATPPHVRRDVMEEIIRSGKSVFCEKPLALSVDDADVVIAAAREAGVAIGIDYVMRHQPAYQLLDALASGGLLGALRTVSLENYAQSMPPEHWFWDQSRSGGILVEHGVHFFDAFGRVAGQARTVWGSMPRREAVEVTVQYQEGALGRYFHEFAYPRAVERTTATFAFEQGWVEIEGWIPGFMHVHGTSPAAPLQAMLRSLNLQAEVETGATTWLSLAFPNRTAAYAAAVVAGMRDTIRLHRDKGHVPSVPIEDARESLVLAEAAQRAVAEGRCLAVSSRR